MPDGVLVAIALAAAALAAAAWWQGGSEQLRTGVGAGLALLARYLPLLVVSFLAAGLAETLIPREAIRGWLGAESGVRGIVIATAAGALTPSGPFVAMPMAAVLARSGAGTGALVAYICGWALLAVHRVVAWEAPILGVRFAALRWGVSVALPVLAGLMARAITRS